VRLLHRLEGGGEGRIIRGALLGLGRKGKDDIVVCVR
jgi:hypothetical protein